MKSWLKTQHSENKDGIWAHHFMANKWENNGNSERLYLGGQRHPTPVLLPGKSHGQRSLVGCSPWGRWGLDTTEQLHFDFSLSCIGEGNGNPLQYSCLENPRDGGAWWAAVYGVSQSRTRLKWLSSSSSSMSCSSFSRSIGKLNWTNLNFCFLSLKLGQLSSKYLPEPWLSGGPD